MIEKLNFDDKDKNDDDEVNVESDRGDVDHDH